MNRAEEVDLRTFFRFSPFCAHDAWNASEVVHPPSFKQVDFFLISSETQVSTQTVHFFSGSPDQDTNHKLRRRNEVNILNNE